MPHANISLKNYVSLPNREGLIFLSKPSLGFVTDLDRRHRGRRHLRDVLHQRVPQRVLERVLHLQAGPAGHARGHVHADLNEIEAAIKRSIARQT